jgi:hypothetical protein
MAGEPSRGANDGHHQATPSHCQPPSAQVTAIPADVRQQAANLQNYMAHRRSRVRIHLAKPHFSKTRSNR